MKLSLFLLKIVAILYAVPYRTVLLRRYNQTLVDLTKVEWAHLSVFGLPMLCMFGKMERAIERRGVN